MTRKEIAKQLCQRCGFSKADALQAVEGLTDILTDAFVNGQSVYLRCFGTMEVRTTKARQARDIHKGINVIVPAHRTVKFKISQQLKKRMNNGTVD